MSYPTIFDVNVLLDDNVKIAGTTDSTSTTSGSFIVAGGVGIAKTVTVGTAVLPNTTGSGSIGSLSRVWQDLYSTNITDTGTSLSLTNLSNLSATSINNTMIGNSVPSSGSFTTLSSSSTTTLGATSAASIDSTVIGGIMAAAGHFTTLNSSSTTALGPTSATSINSTPLGNSNPSTAAVTSLTTNGTATFGGTNSTVELAVNNNSANQVFAVDTTNSQLWGTNAYSEGSIVYAIGYNGTTYSVQKCSATNNSQRAGTFNQIVTIGSTASSAIATSATGNVLYYAYNGTGIYVSYDGGTTQTLSYSTATTINALSCSNSGQTCYAVLNTSGQILLTRNGGLTWNTVSTSPTGTYISICTDGSGKYFATTLSIAGTYYCYYSYNYGVNYVQIGSDSTTTTWNQAVISNDANTVAAITTNDLSGFYIGLSIYVGSATNTSNLVHTSTNFFVLETFVFFGNVAINGNGTIITTNNNNGNATYAFVKSSTWSGVTPAFNGNPMGNKISLVGMSYTGTYQYIATSAASSPFYISTNSGSTWSSTSGTSTKWVGIAVASNPQNYGDLTINANIIPTTNTSTEISPHTMLSMGTIDNPWGYIYSTNLTDNGTNVTCTSIQNTPIGSVIANSISATSLTSDSITDNGSSVIITNPITSDNIIPSVSNTYNLGSGSRTWGLFYTNSIADNGSSVSISNPTSVTSTLTASGTNNTSKLSVTNNSATQVFAVDTTDNQIVGTVATNEASYQVALPTATSTTVYICSTGLTPTTVGVTWSSVTVSSTAVWNSVALSQTGEYILISSTTSAGSLYLSTNFGSTFNAVAGTGIASQVWSQVCMSSTGQYQAAIITTSSLIYYSSNFGQSFATIGAGGGYAAAVFKSIAISSNGLIITACSTTSIVYGTFSGGAWTWTSDVAITTGTFITMNAAGGLIVCAESSSTALQICTSPAVSLTFSSITGSTAAVYSGVALNSAGTYLVACVSSGTTGFYYGGLSGTTWSSTFVSNANAAAVAISNTGAYFSFAQSTASNNLLLYYNTGANSQTSSTGASISHIAMSSGAIEFGTLTVGGNIVPSLNYAANLGSSTNSYNSVYTYNLTSASMTDNGTAVTVANPTSITSNTASSSTVTGALVVTGGVGIGGAIHAGSIQGTPVGSTTRSSGAFSSLSATSGLNSSAVGNTSPSSAAFTTLTANNAVTFTEGTASSSTVSGTVVVTGGVGISGAIYAGSLQGTAIGSTTSSTAVVTTLTSDSITDNGSTVTITNPTTVSGTNSTTKLSVTNNSSTQVFAVDTTDNQILGTVATNEASYQVALPTSANTSVYICSTGLTPTTIGFTWAAATVGTSSVWNSVALSQTGQYILISSTTSAGSLYLSTNYGASFSAVTGTGISSQVWSQVCMSTTGQYQAAIISTSSLIYYSSNFGQSFATIAAGGSYAAATYKSIAISSNGLTVTACSTTNIVYGVFSSGWTWTTTNSITTGTTIAINSSGSIIVVGSSSSSAALQICTTGSALSFSSMTGSSAALYSGVALSSAGTYLVACVSNADFYYGTLSGTTWSPTTVVNTHASAVAISNTGAYFTFAESTATTNNVLLYYNTGANSQTSTIGTPSGVSISHVAMSSGAIEFGTITNGGSLVPSLNYAANLGSSTNAYNSLYTYDLTSASMTDTGTQVTITNPVSMTSGTASTSTSSGSLVVTGGIGASGAIYAGSLQGTQIGNVIASSAVFTTFNSATIADAGVNNGVTITNGVTTYNLLPASDNLYQLGSGAARWATLHTASIADTGSAVTISNPITSNAIAPATTNTSGLGTASKTWASFYTNSITDTGSAVTVANTITAHNITPSTFNAYNLGTTSNYWSQIYTNYIGFGGFGGPFTANTVVQGPAQSFYQMSAFAFNATSDPKLKTNVNSMTNHFSILSQLRPVQYTWIEGYGDNIPEKNMTPQQHYGFLADEVQQVLPQIVVSDDTGRGVAMDYGKLAPIAIACCKELYAQVQTMQSTIDSLQATVASLQTTVNLLQSKIST